MSHFKSSTQGKTGILLATVCRYDHCMFKNTLSSRDLTLGSLCGMYSGYSSWLIFLKRSPKSGSVVLDPVLASVSPKARGWMKSFFVDVLMPSSGLSVYSNCLMTHGDSDYFRHEMRAEI
jgi:hypothetical protein